MSTLYISIILFAVLALLLCNDGKKKSEQKYLIICFIVMLILHTFFNPEYLDKFWYKIAYREYSSMSFSNILTSNAPSLKAEIGYRLLCKLLNFISSEWIIGVFAFSVIMLSGYFVTTKKYSHMYWLSVLLIMVGPFNQSLYVLRQHMAMGIILLSYPCIIEKKVIPYLLLCFCAYMIHQTAAVFLPIYFIFNIKKSKTLVVLFLLLFVVFYYSFGYILSTSASYAMETAAYGDYLFEYDSEAGTNSKMAIFLTAVLALRIYLVRKDFFKEGINKLLSIILLLGVTVSFVGIGFPATSRLNMYFSQINFLIIPNTFQYVSSKERRTLLGLAYFFFLLYFVVRNSYSQDMSDFWFFTK